MKTYVFIGVCLWLSFFIPSVASAECGSIASFDRFTLEGMNTVTLYSGPKAVARFDVQDCNVQPTSDIELLENYVCDGERIRIDGNKCRMMEIKPIGP